MHIKSVIEEYIQYLGKIRRFSRMTVKSYTTDLKQFEDFLNDRGKSELSLVSDRVLKSYLMYLNELGMEVKSISRKLSAVRSLIRYSFRNQYIPNDPSKAVSNPKGKRKLPDVVPQNDLEKVIAEAVKDIESHPSAEVIIEVLYGSALRVSELCSLNRRDVDLNEAILRFTGKGNKMRIVPLGKKSVEAIKRYLNAVPGITPDSPLLRTKKGRRIYSRYVYRLVNKYLGATTSIEKKSPHTLRHSAATHMLDNGADLNAVKEILGHESLSTTQVYTQVSIERLKFSYKKSHPKS